MYKERRKALASALPDTAIALVCSGKAPVSYTHLDVYKRQSICTPNPNHISLHPVLY